MAVSSDEEEDITHLEAVKQKLLAHDPMFFKEQTYSSAMSQHSALITAFRLQYEEGNVEGQAYAWY